ncbi:Polysaccharide pyruvyl transferase [Ruminococcus flavefaciens]|uniref:Polysaccharide pyruvyl transferase n=1 Tax=Ruminococcus flavefaciens TaxID=1265 RepID=A0A1H6IHA9_RUMFL|nr:polysaccharide pyruvyl transferase family protein [Ruminococcus flavefaciens]SEH46580.1 Polysaccharide pyruvyl transferase [Ruminococcus flavefaciens]
MKIGVITWYTGPNYGTNLQAVALQWYLRKQGHDVHIIDYNEELIRYESHRTFMERLKRQPYKYAMIYANSKYGKEIALRDKNLSNTIREKCILTEKADTIADFVTICNQFDLIIVGSDQLWNPGWYSPVYYLDYDEIKTRRIAYSPSLGVNSIPPETAEKIRHGLKKFSAISVREAKGAELLKQLTDLPPKVTVDPTLLLNEDDWLSIFPGGNKKISSKYVLSVFLTDNFNHWHAVKKFAQKHNLQHIIVPYMGFSYFQKGKICADTDLSKLLDLFRSAEYVITDSFHMSVFSIIHKKNFYVFERFKENLETSTNSRVKNLLKMAKLEDRYISYNSRHIKDKSDIDYDNSLSSLEKEILFSREFLIGAIGSDCK